MYRVPRRLAPAFAALLSASFLLSGCVAGPAGLGGGLQRSIKDDAPSAVVAAPPPRRRQVHAEVPIAKAAPPPARPQPAKRSETGAPTCGSGSECIARLKAMIESPNRDWIGRPQPPVEYANGTRLFAYRALRSQLTCVQLMAALAETGTAAITFTAPVPSVSAQQVKRVLVLNSEVQRELQAEFTARCKG